MEYAMCADDNASVSLKKELERPNFNNIKYGIMVEVASLTGNKEKPYDFNHGYHAGMKVHFFNKKGVLLGNLYEFVKYDRIRFRKEKYIYPRKYMDKPFERIRSFIYEIKCNLITWLIRNTQK